MSASIWCFSSLTVRLYPADHARHSAFIRSCSTAVTRVRDLVINHQLAGRQMDPNTQEFVGEFEGHAASGQFVRSADSMNIIVSRKPNNMYLIPCSGVSDSRRLSWSLFH